MSIPPNSETLHQLTCIENQLNQLKTALPYADGPQYYHDKREIQSLEEERRALLLTLKKYPQ